MAQHFIIANEQMGVMAQIREMLDVSERKSYRKILSYHGAVRIAASHERFIEPHCIAHIDADGTKYMDPGNATYFDFFEKTWPNTLRAMGLSNKETVGDMIEAMLGHEWLRRRNTPDRVSPLSDMIIRHIEAAVFATWVCTQTH